MNFPINLIKKNLKKNGKMKIYLINGMKMISMKDGIIKTIILIIGIKTILMILNLAKIFNKHKEQNNI